jgi:hypothetical protein
LVDLHACLAQIGAIAAMQLSSRSRQLHRPIMSELAVGITGFMMRLDGAP